MTTWLERFNLVIFGAALLVGAGLRWLQINTRSFWYDEALSSLIASLSVSQIVANAAGSVHPPGYYLLLHYWSVFGQSEGVLRSLSALFSFCAIPLVFGLGRWLFDRPTAAIAALGMAISPFQIYFAQETRMYGLMTFLAVAIIWSFLYATTTNGRWWTWGGYAVFVILGLYTHYYMAFLVMSLHLWWIVHFKPYKSALVSLMVADVMIGLLFLPQLGQALSRTQAYLGGVAWQTAPNVLSPLTTIYYLLFAHGTPIWLFPMSLFLTLVVLILTAWEARYHPQSRVEAEAALWLSVLMPLAIVMAISWLVKPIYLERSFASGSPALILLIARGMTGAPKRSPTPFLAMLLGFAAVIILVTNIVTPDPAKPPLRDAAQLVEADFQPNDVSLHLQDASFLPAAWYTPGIHHVLADVPGAAFALPAAHRLFGGEMTDWQEATKDADRLWLTVMPGYTGEAQTAVQEKIEQTYPQLMMKDWGSIQLYLYDLKPER